MYILYPKLGQIWTMESIMESPNSKPRWCPVSGELGPHCPVTTFGDTGLQAFWTLESIIESLWLSKGQHLENAGILDYGVYNRVTIYWAKGRIWSLQAFGLWSHLTASMPMAYPGIFSACQLLTLASFQPANGLRWHLFSLPMAYSGIQTCFQIPLMPCIVC